MLYLRGIHSEYWDEKSKDDSISLNDLCTKDHDISVWSVKDDLSDLHDVLLAYAMSRNKPSDFQYLLIPEDAINAIPLNTYQADGDTKFAAIKNKHTNIVVKTGKLMSELSMCMYDSYCEESNPQSVSISELKEWLYMAVKNHQFDIQKLLEAECKHWKSALCQECEVRKDKELLNQLNGNNCKK